MAKRIELTVLQPESCSGCGVCCEGVGSPVLWYQSRPEYAQSHPFRPPDLPEDLIREIDDHFLGMIRGQESTTRCLWFDPQTRKCRHHEWRPQVCRDYEMGGDECLALRRRFLVPAVKAPATAERQEPG